MIRKVVVALGAVALLLVLAGSAALAAGPGDPPSPREGRILGMVPIREKGAKPSRNSSSNLTYHGGPVMHTNSVYAIYWDPNSSLPAGYTSLINQYFTDVHADSGKTTNVYYSDTQYTDGSGAATYNSAFAGYVVDTNPYPANGCRDRYTSICLSDTQIQTEIQNVMSAKGWTGGESTEFFLFTPAGVGSCAGRSCAYQNYCAYHSWIGSGSNAILYANQPYGAWSGGVFTCDSGQRPNNNDADATINLISHEHNETITDQQGNAWYDSQGAENGDKCAWNFGTALGGNSGSYYNQVINNNNYYLQQEWSNKSSGCVLTGQ